MKDLKELYSEIISSEEIKKEFLEAAKTNEIEEFLKAHDCNASIKEVQAFLEEKSNETKELSLEEMDNVAGGTCNRTTAEEVLTSVISIGTYCAVEAVISAVSGTVGQNSEEEGRLCNTER